MTCDYCDEGLPTKTISDPPRAPQVWHYRVDPEGVDGEQRMPCTRPYAIEDAIHEACAHPQKLTTCVNCGAVLP